jgi:hypothetical protein
MVALTTCIGDVDTDSVYNLAVFSRALMTQEQNIYSHSLQNLPLFVLNCSTPAQVSLHRWAASVHLLPLLSIKMPKLFFSFFNPNPTRPERS